jgi:hypothetical protein
MVEALLVVTLGDCDIAGIVRQHFLAELDEGVCIELYVTQGCKGRPSVIVQDRASTGKHCLHIHATPRWSGYRTVLDRVLQGQDKGHVIRRIVLRFRQHLLGNKWTGTGRDHEEVDGGGAETSTCRKTSKLGVMDDFKWSVELSRQLLECHVEVTPCNNRNSRILSSICVQQIEKLSPTRCATKGCSLRYHWEVQVHENTVSVL